MRGLFNTIFACLAERAEDIPALANYFLSRTFLADVKHISKDAIKLLQQHNWKGNIRELRNVIDIAIIITSGTEILPEDLPYEIQKGTQQIGSLSLATVEKQHIQKVLLHTKGKETKQKRPGY